MKTNIDKQLSVEEIAREFHYSPSHYTALFKKKTGLSPIDYFIRIKIHYACQLLSQRELIIKEIADKVGYEDPYYFSRISVSFSWIISIYSVRIDLAAAVHFFPGESASVQTQQGPPNRSPSFTAPGLAEKVEGTGVSGF